MKIQLSLCIPTYNRAKFLTETIESILTQFNDEVELIISDNASEDNTTEIVQRYQQLHPRITYHRWDKNMGADANFLKVVELSRGKFCWFIGSDDTVTPGAIEKVISYLKRRDNASGLSVNSLSCSYDMSFKQNVVFGMPQITNQPFMNDKWYEHGSEAFYHLADYFGYISAQIVNRRLWNEVIVTCNVAEYFQAHVHVYVISEMLIRYGNWGYIHYPCINYRSGNDSFLERGNFYRLSILVKGYEKIISNVWWEFPFVQRSVSNLILRIHVMNLIGGVYLKTPLSVKIEPWYFFRSFLLCFSFYWEKPFFWIQIAPFCMIPRPIIFLIKKVKRVITKL